jgi:hypothetical protein
VNDPATEPPRGSRPWIGLAVLGALLLYTGAIHHGLGPARLGPDAPWYAPTGFLSEHDLTLALLDPPGLAFVALGLPALLMLCGVLLFSRSALAGALATSCVVATLLFVYYGLVAPFPWQFFGATGSAVLLLLASAIGFSLTAPLLAGSWLRLAWPMRVTTYLPVVLLVIGFLRNATGTDESMPFAISPWPVVPVFGLEVGALFVAVGLLGTAIGVTGIARGADARGRAALALAAGLLVPALLLLAGSALSLLPFRVGMRLVVGIGLACAVSIALAATLGVRRRPDALAARARRIVAGAILLGAPLLAGQAWAYIDYYATREFQAGRIIDALEAYRERETLYPDSLEVLVEAGDLAAIPEPSIGFDFLYDGKFDYQGFGTSYLLQFPAPRWVQCAYTPAMVMEEYEDDEYADEWSEEDLGASWSCPSRPPELW